MIKAIVIISDVYRSIVYSPEELGALRERVDLVSEPISREAVAANLEILRDVVIIFSGWGPPIFDEAFLSAAPKLRMVFYAAGSVKTFLTDAFWERGVRITSARVTNGEAVADYTVGAMLFGLKQGFASAASVRRSRDFTRLALPAGVFGSTVALISLGAAGRGVCAKLRSFGPRIVAYDPLVSTKDAQQLGVTLVDLSEAFAQADVVSVHTPSMPETKGMIRGKHFSLMRNGATFINTARGCIVREHEMVEVLAQRPDLTAILDVTEPEPPLADSRLHSLPNVILTPHIAGALGRDARLLSRAMIQELDHYLRGESLNWEIRKDSLAYMA